jgi:2-hydroxy-6-oxonona-2,4-dienedioate hydrolase
MDAKYLTINGCKIRYFDNERSGPVLFLSHGVGASFEFWEELVTLQDNSFRMIAWDLPGHGRSDFLNNKDYRLDLFAQYAWQLLDHLKVNHATLVGNSLGGAVSLRMLKQQEPRVDKLVLLNAAMIGNDAPQPFRLMTIPVLGEFMTRSSDMAYKQQIEAIFAKSYQVTDKMPAVIKRNVSRPGAQAAFLATIRQCTSLGGQSKSLVNESYQILSTMTKPTLFIHGTEDKVIPLSHSEDAHKFTPGSKLMIMQDCGHTPHVEKAHALLQALKEFVQT